MIREKLFESNLTSVTQNREVIFAKDSDASVVEQLRYHSYHHSSAFTVIDSSEIEIYLRWSKRDREGIVLLATNENNEPISTLRGNIYHSLPELEENNPIFKDAADDFLQFPVLDLTIGATNPLFFRQGHLSVLRYYMYFLHRHTVKSVSGAVVKNSSSYNLCKKFGYKFRDVDTVGTGVAPSDNWTIMSIETTELDSAINYLGTKYAEQIKDYPLIK